jgi:hypothetical protein
MRCRAQLARTRPSCPFDHASFSIGDFLRGDHRLSLRLDDRAHDGVDYREGVVRGPRSTRDARSFHAQWTSCKKRGAVGRAPLGRLTLLARQPFSHREFGDQQRWYTTPVQNLESFQALQGALVREGFDSTLRAWREGKEAVMTLSVALHEAQTPERMAKLADVVGEKGFAFTAENETVDITALT